jgi:hypothetical protein
MRDVRWGRCGAQGRKVSADMDDVGRLTVTQ